MRLTARTLAAGFAVLALGGGASSAAAATPAAAEGASTTLSESSPAPAAGAGAPQQPASPTTTGAASIAQLSNETTLTIWAHPEIPGQIYVQPDSRSRRIAKLHMYTEDGFPEVYLLLSSYIDAEGREWAKLRIPGRPNGRTGWTLRELLGAFHRTSWRIEVDRRERRMRVYYSGSLRRVFPVGVGKPSAPTPPGRFWIRERFRLTNPSNPYWPYALGTSDYSTLSEWPGGGVVGIHGAFGEPQKIPGDPSHGCIRMLDPDIAWLAPRITLGTPVEIL